MLIRNRIRDETDGGQDLGRLGREVLIDFEVHAVSSAGRSMAVSYTHLDVYKRQLPGNPSQIEDAVGTLHPFQVNRDHAETPAEQ